MVAAKFVEVIPVTGFKSMSGAIRLRVFVGGNSRHVLSLPKLKSGDKPWTRSQIRAQEFFEPRNTRNTRKIETFSAFIVLGGLFSLARGICGRLTNRGTGPTLRRTQQKEVL